jgi:RNA polymerase sigma-70 factor, ECF subfamily
MSMDEAVRAPSQDVDLAVNEALAALGDLDRDVFLMREVAGLGYEEIARACGLTPDAVRSRIHRARLHLRGCLASPIATRRTIPMRQSGRQP